MANWTIENQPFGGNRAPLLTGVSESDGKTPIPVAVDPATGRLLVNSVGGAAATSVAINDGVTVANKATVAVLTNANPLAVEVVDGSGNQITSFGGGTQYTDGGSPPTHPVGPTLEWNNAGTWATAGSAAPLPVTANAGTNLNTSALATSANLTAGTQKTQTVDGSGAALFGSAAALADSTANPTLAGVQVYPMGYNGTTWDRLHAFFMNADAQGVQTGLYTLGQNLMYNGTNWDRIRGDVTNGQWVNVKTSVLPTSAATSTKQSDGTQKTQIVDGSGNVIASTSNALNINLSSGSIPAGTNAIGTVGTTSGAVNVNQVTVSTSAVQFSAGSAVPENGILVQALSTNGASVFVGGSGVTTANGFELQAGQCISFTCNLNTLYVISAASTTDKICYNVV